ncbi:MAG: prepilin-type N-terminal cleavage/methylation domain-containing protein [Phycisphaeraceae bacterium]|nr:prepilin-type N-terminal cleavage/methylation domain-containing protein [Phycisphaeraceae bacterium]
MQDRPRHKDSDRLRRTYRRRGVSLVELMAALVISALLLTATMVATDASFKAYAIATEEASAQISGRMVMTRMLTLVRTSTAHGPLLPDATVEPPATLIGNTITSPYIELIDQDGNLVRVEYRTNDLELWSLFTPADGGAQQEQPIIGGVTAAVFTLERRLTDDNIFVLDRATFDLTVQPSIDATLPVESEQVTSVRLIASTMPRRLEQ